MDSELSLSELVDVLSELALEVSSLVLVDDVDLGELVEERRYLGEHSSCLILVGSKTESLDSVAGGLGVVAIVLATSSDLASPLDCRLMVCHFFLVEYLFNIRFLDCQPTQSGKPPKFADKLEAQLFL